MVGASGSANRVVPIGATPVQVSGVFSSDYQIVNVGSETVYLGQQSAVSTENYGVPLAPLASLRWSGSSELWGVCESGKESRISLLYSADSVFTPGPSTVSVGVEIEELVTQSFNPPHATTYTKLLTLADLGTAKSISVKFNGDPGPLPPHPVHRIIINWNDDSGLYTLQQDSALIAQAGSIVWNVPRRSNRAAIIVYFADINTSSQLLIYSSSLEIESFQHRYNPDFYYVESGVNPSMPSFTPALDALAFAAKGTITGNYVLGVPHYAGLASLNVNTGVAPTTTVLTTYSQFSTTPSDRFIIASAPSSTLLYASTVRLPRSPIFLAQNVPSPAAWNMGMVFDGKN